MTKKKTEPPNETEKEVTDLRAAIAKLTGRVPASDDPRYLAQRLAALEARKEAGLSVRRKRSDGSHVISVSMPAAAGELFETMLHKEKLTASQLVRAAIAMLARARGYSAAAEAMSA